VLKWYEKACLSCLTFTKTENRRGDREVAGKSPSPPVTGRGENGASLRHLVAFQRGR
jgi:hypothetical protein